MSGADGDRRARNRELVERYFTTDIGRAAERVAMWAPDGVKEFAWAPDGVAQTRWEGTEELTANANRLAEMLRSFRHVELEIHATEDPDAFWVQSRSSEDALKDGRPFPMRYVHFVRVRDGRLVLHREFFDSQLMAAAVAPPQPASAAERRLAELGLAVPVPHAAVANYLGAVTVGRIVFVSGHAPFDGDELPYVGKVGAEIDVATAQRAAALVILQALGSLKAEIGDLDRVRRIVKLLGMVNSAPDFTDQPAVIDGASDILTHMFGERGRHARSAVGMGSLPFGIPVEIEMIVEID